jgi:hypothetical protein
MQIKVQTYINELFQVIVEIRQVLFPPLVVCNELLLPLQQLLALLLQSLALNSFVIDSGKHERILVGIAMLRKLRQKLLHGDEGQLLVLVTAELLSACCQDGLRPLPQPSSRDNSLVSNTSGYFAL